MMKSQGRKMVEITSTSKHTKTQSGTQHPAGHIQAIKTVPVGKDALGFSRGRQEKFDRPAGGQTVGVTNKDFNQYTVAYGKGSNRKSVTKHCSPDAIQKFIADLKKQGY